MPIAWDELDTVAPDGIGMADALARLEMPDPWGGFFKEKQQLK
jgi:bifunctional non-homologous end joining protein LigD